MIDLNVVYNEMEDDIESVKSWVGEIYSKNFAEHFAGQRDLFKRLQSKSRPITDDELEWILTALPLEMFSAAEKLSEFKISQEVVKMKNKKKLSELKESSTASTQTKKQEEAELQILENKLIDTVYSALLDRVDKEMSFTRELIMSAKKIWDRRRATEEASPISPTDPQLPTLPGHKTYYEQMQAAKGQPIYG